MFVATKKHKKMIVNHLGIPASTIKTNLTFPKTKATKGYL
jgi:hypothetical protein